MIFTITVKPNSKKGPLVVSADGSSVSADISYAPKDLIVYLREKPIDGSANLALIKHLSKHFRIPKTCINIKTGARSHKKFVEIIGKTEKF